MTMLYAMMYGSYEDFLAEYTPASATEIIKGRTYLFDSVSNPDIDARIAITNRLLDDGADPSVADRNLNVLHVLFGSREHDPQREAPMLRRLIEGGADVNLVSGRGGPPLTVLMDHVNLPDEARVPFYDVIFSRPELDLSVWSGTAKLPLGEYILIKKGFPELRKRVTEFNRSR